MRLLVDAAQGIQAQTLANVYLAIENDSRSSRKQEDRSARRLTPMAPPPSLPISSAAIPMPSCGSRQRAGSGVEAVLDAVVAAHPVAGWRSGGTRSGPDLRLDVRPVPRSRGVRPVRGWFLLTWGVVEDDGHGHVVPEGRGARVLLARARGDPVVLGRRGRVCDHRLEGCEPPPRRRHPSPRRPDLLRSQCPGTRTSSRWSSPASSAPATSQAHRSARRRSA